MPTHKALSVTFDFPANSLESIKLYYI